MPILNRVHELQTEVAGWRRYIHENPGLLYDVEHTADFVAEKLKEFGCDVVETGIGKTGVVGLIKGSKGEGQTIGLRADMDALPITEASGVEWTSKKPGLMHACGHDGHTSMLLGAAKYLAETRNFKGAVAVIFQPAEEGGAGALAMIEDGMMEKFKISEVYGMHNKPGLPVGQFETNKGPSMAAADEFKIFVEGKGGHAASPHHTIDPVVVSAHMILAVQALTSRETDPLHSLVITIASIHGGDTHNVIPNTVTLHGTVRSLLPETRDFAERRLKEVVSGIAATFGAKAEVQYERGYPVTFNHPKETDFAVEVLEGIVGEKNVFQGTPPTMGAEDFSYMLEKRPGTFINIGNGNTAGLHHPAYDFNDEAIPYGISYWVALTESALAN
ncbi:M20 aminoacylase family protein [Rhizobium sp. L1K21]|uniref:M20 aminoacylase family protein n=1 Tax=Rhizobium sp. L1K21 TaxID=2954933 RepID=UPI002093A109|nr:M20 aminoacylase family protein [Rhizobium sp. L1K21]MCO6188304.1 M20 family metallopeptidase [Rhizobium sp. L1K21]